MRTKIFRALFILAAFSPSFLNAAPDVDPAPPLANDSEAGKGKQTNADFKAFFSALLMYKLNAGFFPTEKQGLASLVEKPTDAPIPRRWTQIMKTIPKDPWGRAYRYVTRVTEKQVEHVIISDGPDFAVKTDDLELVLEAGLK